MKKWAALLLLILTLASTLYPCCLADDCNEEEVAMTHQEDSDDADGACSPFFACTSCAGFVQLAKPIQLVKPEVAERTPPATVILFELPTYSRTLWHPPRAA